MFISQPYEDELLSSFLIRIAHKNHTNISTIINSIFKGNKLAEHSSKFHIKDVDLYDLDKTQQKLFYKKMGHKADSLQLFNYIGFLDEKVDRYNKKWISEIKATRHNSKHFYATRYCPLCLKEKPYISRFWRIMFYNTCHKHNSYLRVVCPKCNAKFMYFNNEYSKEIYQCYNCSYDLRNSPTMKAKAKDIRSQKKLLKILEVGYYKLNSRIYYSMGLFVLIKKMLHTIMKIKKIKVKYINELTPLELSRMITHVMFLFEKFPERLNRFYKRNKLTNISKILSWDEKDKGNFILPSWYMSNLEYRALTKIGKKRN